jgi:hypothetical protein
MPCSYLLWRLVRGYPVTVQVELPSPGDGLKDLHSRPVWY